MFADCGVSQELVENSRPTCEATIAAYLRQRHIHCSGTGGGARRWFQGKTSATSKKALQAVLRKTFAYSLRHTTYPPPSPRSKIFRRLCSAIVGAYYDRGVDLLWFSLQRIQGLTTKPRVESSCRDKSMWELRPTLPTCGREMKGKEGRGMVYYTGTSL